MCTTHLPTATNFHYWLEGGGVKVGKGSHIRKNSNDHQMSVAGIE